MFGIQQRNEILAFKSHLKGLIGAVSCTCFTYQSLLSILHLSSNLALKALPDVLYAFDKRDRSIEKLHNLLKMMVAVVVTSQEATQGRKS